MLISVGAKRAVVALGVIAAALMIGACDTDANGGGGGGGGGGNGGGSDEPTSENAAECRRGLEELQRQAEELDLPGEQNQISDEEIDAACGG
jgi:hypothetical protein